MNLIDFIYGLTSIFDLRSSIVMGSSDIIATDGCTLLFRIFDIFFMTRYIENVFFVLCDINYDVKKKKTY